MTFLTGPVIVKRICVSRDDTDTVKKVFNRISACPYIVSIVCGMYVHYLPRYLIALYRVYHA